MTTFTLDPRLEEDCLPVGRFALSRLLLMNDATYPWLILVPGRSGISELFELDADDLAALGAETALVARMLKALVAAEKINVAALGNVVAQLHVHVIARFSTDPAWPAPVWGRAPARPYKAHQAAQMLRRIDAALQARAAGAAAGPAAQAKRAPPPTSPAKTPPALQRASASQPPSTSQLPSASQTPSASRTASASPLPSTSQTPPTLQPRSASPADTVAASWRPLAP